MGPEALSDRLPSPHWLPDEDRDLAAFVEPRLAQRGRLPEEELPRPVQSAAGTSLGSRICSSLARCVGDALCSIRLRARPGARETIADRLHQTSPADAHNGRALWDGTMCPTSTNPAAIPSPTFPLAGALLLQASLPSSPEPLPTIPRRPTNTHHVGEISPFFPPFFSLLFPFFLFSFFLSLFFFPTALFRIQFSSSRICQW